MNAEKYGLDRIYFGGCFIRGMLEFLGEYPLRAHIIVFRSCVDHFMSVVCDSILESRHGQSHVPQTRGIPVRLISLVHIRLLAHTHRCFQGINRGLDQERQSIIKSSFTHSVRESIMRGIRYRIGALATGS